MSSALSPLVPMLNLRPLRKEDEPMVGALLGQQLLQATYSRPINTERFLANLLQPSPPSLYAVRWHRHQVFCVWRAGALEGLIDVGVGFDDESLDLPDYSPLGLLRFLLLPKEATRVDDVTALLLDAAITFWRQQGVGLIKAFHMSTGYPEFQAGFGALPGDWAEQIRILTTADFHFTERYYRLLRPLDSLLEERLPSGGLSLAFRGDAANRHYQLYHHADRLGEAHMVALQSSFVANGVTHPLRLANLLKLEVHPEWRGHDIGKWLLRRLINDATMQGYQQMLVHIPHRAFIMQNLLLQHGFQEQNYRGYTLERTLTN